MKQNNSKKLLSLLYNLIMLGLFFGGMYFFLWRFCGAFVLILTYNDPKFGSDYWLDQPLVVYSGFILIYIIHWLLLVLGRKKFLVSNRMDCAYFVLDILIFTCSVALGYLVLFAFVMCFPYSVKEIGFGGNIAVLFFFYLHILPQVIICKLLFTFRILFVNP